MQKRRHLDDLGKHKIYENLKPRYEKRSKLKQSEAGGDRTSDEYKEQVGSHAPKRSSKEKEEKKSSTQAAHKVTVAALEAIPPIDERYLDDALESVPLVKGDNVMVPYFGGRITFQVIEITPVADGVVVTQKTAFEIIEKENTKKRKTIPNNFFNDLQEMYDEELESLQRCLDDRKLFNELVGELLIRTNGAIAPTTASKFVESMGELSCQ